MKKELLFLSLILLLLLGCQNQLYKIEKTEQMMGTFATIAIIDKDAINAGNAIKEAFGEIKRIENIMSNFNESSEVYKLNRAGYLDSASNELLFVLKKSLYYSEISKGAFDITVQPLLDLYTESFGSKGQPPNDEEIKEVKKLVNYSNIIIDNKTVYFATGGMKITLGGVAKGYAIDRAILILEKNDIKNALVNIGGDLRAIGNKQNDQPWSIALQNPRDKTDYIRIIPIQNTAIATSGDYERYFAENKSVHHIMDPRTGKSATDLISVTIITDRAIDADALATSVFVLGLDRGLDLIRKEKAEGLIITKDKEIFTTNGFENYK